MSRFFKTAVGQYGAGDVFIGITVPMARKVALQYRDLPLRDVERLLASKLHEHRFCGLEILVWRYEHGGEAEQKEIFRFYLDHTAGINNWDLVDNSAPYIVGEHLRGRWRGPLKRLARSTNLWERRIAIVATLQMVRYGELEATFEVARLLLGDKHDLIHKAVGWALREAGKISRPQLIAFLANNYPQLPRTTLRYAIERFSPAERKSMLTGSFA